MSSLKIGKSGVEEVWVVAKYDYQAQGSHELDLRKNERLHLLDDSKHWWRVMNQHNQSGYVPSNFVKKEKPSIFDSIKKRVKKGSSVGGGTKMSGGSGTPTHGDSLGKGGAPVDLSDAIGYAVVKYNYQAQQMDELSLAKGSRVQILEKSNDGWWRGHVNGSVGWFPSNYTTEEPPDEDHTYTVAENVLDVVVALYTFTAQNEHELSFSKGDRMEILDRPPSDPEWYRARNTQREVGLIPRNYVKELHEVVDTRTPSRGGNANTAARSSQAPPATNGGSHGASDAAHVTQGVSGLSISGGGGVDKSGMPLAAKEWYYGPISRAQCDTLLNTRGHDGDYLIRDSETNAGDFSVSLKASNRNKHFRVHVESGFYCIGQRKFNNLDQLVEHYQRSPIYTSQKGEKLYLVRPLPRL
ncbi:cytoplasmic protein NCK1-like isoform X2 [Hyalella azteca]|uniref:Cytoplasmic protein NCK1-like isoform X2 n=1 Tax=Hyalella azteca TaxID=294128 RepID=A0A8B7NIX7_HYAAZ|nr:cytoplasmic protein NCK1-like isoform X2 [Hyalella azteca]